MRRFSTLYGSSPLHLLLGLAAFVVSAWAVAQAFDRLPPSALTKWFVGAIIAHDLVLLPLYSIVLVVLVFAFGARAAREGRRASRARLLVLNHLRVPAALSLLGLLLFFPLILGLAEGGYHGVSGLSTQPYLGRWLLLSAGLFAASGIALVLRLLLGAVRGKPGPAVPAATDSESRPTAHGHDGDQGRAATPSSAGDGAE